MSVYISFILISRLVPLSFCIVFVLLEIILKPLFVNVTNYNPIYLFGIAIASCGIIIYYVVREKYSVEFKHIHKAKSPYKAMMIASIAFAISLIWGVDSDLSAITDSTTPTIFKPAIPSTVTKTYVTTKLRSTAIFATPSPAPPISQPAFDISLAFNNLTR